MITVSKSVCRRRTWLCVICGLFFFRTVSFTRWGKRTARCPRCGDFDTEPIKPLALPWGATA